VISFTLRSSYLRASPLRLTTSNFIFQLNTCGCSPYVTSSLMRGCLSFTIAAGPRQHSHSRVRVPRDSWSYFTVSELILPKPGGLGPRIYIPQEQGGPVIPPGTGFPFRRLLWLAGLRWRYSAPPPHGSSPRKFPHTHCVRAQVPVWTWLWKYESLICWESNTGILPDLFWGDKSQWLTDNYGATDVASLLSCRTEILTSVCLCHTIPSLLNTCKYKPSGRAV
jgi:hypothetical protein